MSAARLYLVVSGGVVDLRDGASVTLSAGDTITGQVMDAITDADCTVELTPATVSENED